MVEVLQSPSSSRCLDHQEDLRFRALRLLEANPAMKQRELAVALNLSLGKAHYCVQALLDKGLIKVQRFHDSPSKRAYLYLLTPAGVAEKARITLRFLQRKMAEYDRLREEIESLRERGVNDYVGGRPDQRRCGLCPRLSITRSARAGLDRAWRDLAAGTQQICRGTD